MFIIRYECSKVNTGYTGEATRTKGIDAHDTIETDTGAPGSKDELPLIPCNACGKAANWVCAQCVYEGDGWWCEGCAALSGI